MSLLFPPDERLAQVDDSVLSKFICDVFSRLRVKLHASFVGIAICVILVTLQKVHDTCYLLE